MPAASTGIRRQCRLLFLGLGIVLGGCSAESSDLATSATESEGSSQELSTVAPELGRPTRLDLSAGARILELRLGAGEALVATVDQLEVDVALRLLRSPGSPAARAALPTGRAAPETLCYVATEGGKYDLEVSALGDPLAEVEVRIQFGPRRQEDAACQRALEAYERLRDEDPASSEDWDRALGSARRSGRWELEAGIRARRAFRSFARSVRERKTENASEELFEHAEAILQLVVDESEPSRGRAWRHHLAWTAIELAQLEVAERLLEPIRASSGVPSPGWLEAETQELSGTVALYQGRASDAKRELERALALWRRFGLAERGAVTFANLAAALLMEQRFGDARELLSEAMAIVPQEARAGRRAVLMQLGWLEMMAGAPERAIEHYRQGVALLDEGPSMERAGFLDRWATAEKRLGHLERAERLYVEAWEQLEDPEGLWAAHVRLNLGDLMNQQDRLEPARDHLSAAAEGFRERDFNAHAHTLAALGLVERKRAHLDLALAHLQHATEQGDRLWLQAFAKGDLARPTTLVRDIDAHYVDLLLELASTRGRSELLQRA
ncbi:MAG: hypothetical protein MI919_21035, partial [Holophagales bacterium]|nr:hypothetical protein [Holophagales bacterium]